MANILYPNTQQQSGTGGVSSVNTNPSHFLASRRNRFCYRGTDIYEGREMEATFRHFGYYCRNRHTDVSYHQPLYSS